MILTIRFNGGSVSPSSSYLARLAVLSTARRHPSPFNAVQRPRNNHPSPIQNRDLTMTNRPPRRRAVAAAAVTQAGRGYCGTEAYEPMFGLPVARPGPGRASTCLWPRTVMAGQPRPASVSFMIQSHSSNRDRNPTEARRAGSGWAPGPQSKSP